MEIPKPEPGRWIQSAVVAKKPNSPKKSRRKNADTAKKVTNSSENRNSKSPKCLIKITGSRYNGTFLVSVDPTMDDAIYKTMREIEVGLGHQLKRKPSTVRVAPSPKSCLSSVFKCFTQSGTLQDRKKYMVESPKKVTNRSAKDAREFRPVWAKLPERLEPIEASVVKKLNSSSIQFKKQEENCVTTPKPVSSNLAISSTKVPKSDESSYKLMGKKKAHISNSVDQISMSRSPKTLSGFSGIEIGLKVQPNVATAEERRRVTKLHGNDELLRNGCRSLQNGDKRSLYVSIEEVADGKPFLKLAFSGGNRDDFNKKIDQRSESDDDYLIREDKNDVVQTVKRNKDNTAGILKQEESKSCQREENKSFKSTEVQVSGDLGRENDSTQPTENINHTSKCNTCCLDSGSQNYKKLFPTQRLMNIFRRRNCVPESETKTNRMPYIVHKLYDPKSILVTKPAYSRAVDRMIQSRTSCLSNSTLLRNTRFDDLSNSSIRNIKPELSTQYINEEVDDYRPKRDFGMSTSTVDDFDEVLQNICGPNYWYHRSETSSLNRNDGDMSEHNINCSSEKRLDLNCNRGSQTENLNVDTTTGQEGRTEGSNVNLLIERNLEQINSYNFNADLRRRKIRTVHTCTESDLVGRGNIGHLLDTSKDSGNRSTDLEALDTAKNEFLNKFKSLQIGEPKPSIEFSKGTADLGPMVTGNGAVEAHRNDIPIEVIPLDEELPLKKQSVVVRDPKNNSFLRETKNVINMTPCIEMQKQFGDEKVAEKIKWYQQEEVANVKRAIKIKSRSCQDISKIISRPEIMEGAIPVIQERKFCCGCWCFMSSRTGKGFSLGYGIGNTKRTNVLERGTGKSKLKYYSDASHLEGCSAAAQDSDICRNLSVHRISMDRLSAIANVDRSNDQPRSGLFYRTIRTIKNKITHLFGRNESTRNLNKVKSNMHDKIVFIPVPLEKKHENIQLLKKKRNKFF
ncbi:hypothetical protein GE061_011592 [Apolygus lucorum]|uniref:Uncharacterized protein n=1 Tax=Apolygus lucorum TaxID=248454 RepID=A0A6A4KB18_APOLU|nr:hypothetical protein GE061_011592 [Apolygus lucorum]